MFGSEKFVKIFKRLDLLENEIKTIRHVLEEEIKIIERAGKPVLNEITESLNGEFYNHPLRDLTQEINGYFDSVISQIKLYTMIANCLKKYELDVSSVKNYLSYLEKTGLIKGMMERDTTGFHPFYSINKDKVIPAKKKLERGMLDELGMS